MFAETPFLVPVIEVKYAREKNIKEEDRCLLLCHTFPISVWCCPVVAFLLGKGNGTLSNASPPSMLFRTIRELAQAKHSGSVEPFHKLLRRTLGRLDK